LIEVELGDLKKLRNEITELLEEKLKITVTVKGNSMLFPDSANGPKMTVKDAKDAMKHVIHHLRLSDGFRVLTDQGKVRIVKVQPKAKRSEKEGTPPSPSATLPYLFP